MPPLTYSEYSRTHTLTKNRLLLYLSSFVFSRQDHVYGFRCSEVQVDAKTSSHTSTELRWCYIVAFSTPYKEFKKNTIRLDIVIWIIVSLVKNILICPVDLEYIFLASCISFFLIISMYLCQFEIPGTFYG